MVDTHTKCGKAAFTGCLAAAGTSVWVVDTWLLQPGRPGWGIPARFAIDPLSALIFLPACASLLLLMRSANCDYRSSRFLRLASRGCAVVVLLFGLVALGSFSDSCSAKIEAWSSSEALKSVFPGLAFPAPNTSLNFILFGGALLASGTMNRTAHFGSKFAVVVASLISFVAILGRAFGFSPFSSFGAAVPMTLSSALTFLLLAASFLLAHTDHGLLRIIASDSLGGMVARRLLPAGILIHPILGWTMKYGESHGFYTIEVSAAGMALGQILSFTAIICWCANGFYREELERKKAEALLRESEKRFSGAFTYSPIGTALVSPQGRWLKVNPAMCELVGYSEAELLARTFQDITHPDDLEIGLEQHHLMLMGKIVGFQVEKRYLHADGHVLTVLLNTSLVRDETGQPSHCVTQIQDICERKNAETALLKSRYFLRSTLDALSAHVAILDEDGVILEVNEAWNRFDEENGETGAPCGVGDNYLQACDAATGYEREDGIGMASGLRAVMAGERATFRLEYPCHGTREKRWFVVRVTRFEDDGAARLVVAHQDITPRKHAEEELRWKTAFLEAEVNSSLDGILVVDQCGQQILRNQRFVDVWKLPRRFLDESNEKEQIQWAANATADPAAFTAKVRYLFEHPDEKGRDEILLKDGTVLDRYSAPVIGENGTHYGRIWTFRDITERKRIEESLRESEARFQHIAANVPGMVFRFVQHPDGTFNIPFVSGGSREVYGLEPEQIQNNGRMAMDAVLPEDRPDHQQSIADAAASMNPWRWQGRIRQHSTGAVRCLQGVSRPERQANGDVVWDGLIIDITERKQAEEDRRAKEDAERTNQEKSKFLSRMSHELRTPLNAILGFGQVLEFSQLKEQDAVALRYILKGGRHLLSLIDEVLDLSRAETGELRLILGRVDAAAIARECIDLMTRLACARGVTCTIKNFHGPVILWCDEQRLRQVLLNLLSNAIKYNREGGRVSLGFEFVFENRVRLTVNDTGPGIPPEGMARLFVPFERLDRENGEIEGTGLGLVVSRRIAEAMGGSLGVTSDAGHGSTFWIELPKAATVDDSPANTARLTDFPIPGIETPPSATLLYIEDNPSNLQVVQMLMTRLRPHWQFLSARDGSDGLELARRHLPDVILLDLQLPGMAGTDVLEALCGDPKTCHIPVLVLSADATAHSRERLLAGGATAYLSKPFQTPDLLKLLDGALDKARVR